MMNKSIEEIVEFLIDKKLTITTAESCTGGLIASAIVDIPGVSEIFHEGYVTYSNDAKERLLGVAPKTISDHGVVSSQTAAEMATGAARTAHTTIALSSTGVAGPDGGTKEHPVGDVSGPELVLYLWRWDFVQVREAYIPLRKKRMHLCFSRKIKRNLR